MCYLDLGHHSTMYMYSNHHMVHFKYNYICQLFLNKVGKNKIKPTFKFKIDAMNKASEKDFRILVVPFLILLGFLTPLPWSSC